MNKKVILLFSVLLIVACNNKDSKIVKKEFDNNGNLIFDVELVNGIRQGKSTHYYPKKEYKYSKSVILWEKDTAYYQKNYNKQNKLLSEGSLKEYNFKIGKWKFYDSEQNLKEIQEFVDFQNKTYLNQNWKINLKGDTIGGNYYKIILTDTIKLNTTNRVYFFLEQPTLSNESDLVVYLSRYNAFTDRFFENDTLKFDRIDNLAFRFRKKNLHQDKNHHIIFDFDAKKIGRKEISGYLIEIDKSSNKNFDSITKKTFFRHSFYVK